MRWGGRAMSSEGGRETVRKHLFSIGYTDSYIGD